MSGPPGRKILGVSEITDRIIKTLEKNFRDAWVKGEIADITRHSSGHWYFSLKDERAILHCVMFKFVNRYVRFRPDVGMEVLCRGKVSGYAPRGAYQLNVEHMEPLGQGALHLEFERLKEKLSREGLFEAERKRPIPERPRRIGIITSPTGAALHDVLRVLAERDPGIEVLIIPSRVQGEGAARRLAKAIAMANRPALARPAGRRPLEVLIVGRGGGSIEDLWAFNEEELARAIAKSRLPVISAVGHEVDFTIADFVADMRAATPTAAAELVAAGRAERKRRFELLIRRLADPRREILELMMRVDELSARSRRLAVQALRSDSLRLVSLMREMLAQEPRRRLKNQEAMLGQARSRLVSAGGISLERSNRRLDAAWSRLLALSPRATLSRGYSIVRDGEGRVVRDAGRTDIGAGLEVILHKGRLGTRVESIDLEDGDE